MMNGEKFSGDVKQMIDQFLDNTISDQDIEQLDRLLNESASLRTFFLNYCQMHIELGNDAAVEQRAERVFDAFRERKQRISAVITPLVGVVAAPAHGLSIFSNTWCRGIATAVRRPLLIFAFGILAGVLVGFFVLKTKNETQQLTRERSMPAAYLMSANGCSWGRGMPNLQLVGSEIQMGGEITLDEGIAEFRLANGVYVSLEGPAALVLASPLSLALQYGKVTAHVPWTVADFKVSAGACRFTTCDADFGLIETGSKTDLHVFAGSVQVENQQVLRKSTDFDFLSKGSLVIDDSGALTKGAVSAGNALSILHVGDVLKVSDLGQKAKPEYFANKLSMAGPLPVNPAYVEAVLASKPVGYWRFESASNGRVPNEIPSGRDLEILGDIGFVNQLGNSVAEFRPNLVGRFKCEKFTQQAEANYSFEAWVKPSHLHFGNILSFYNYTSGVYSSSSLLVHAGKDRRLKNPAGVFSFAHYRSRTSEGGPPEFYCFSKKQYDVRRWQHVVVSKDGSHVRLYIDGKLAASQRDATELAARLTLSIGRNPESRERRFVGQLDEVAFYNRALSREEISRHYEIIDAAFRLPSTAQAVQNRVSRQRPQSRLQATADSGSANAPTFLAAVN